MTNQLPQNFGHRLVMSITLINHWLHWLVIDFIHYSSLSSRGCSWGPPAETGDATKEIEESPRERKEWKNRVYETGTCWCHRWVIDRPQNFGPRLPMDYSWIIANNQWLFKWLLIDSYKLIPNWCHWSSISYVWNEVLKSQV